MNTFLELAKSRHSVRSYESKSVEAEKLNAILEAGRIAPTAANGQPCRFLVLNEAEALQKLQKSLYITQRPAGYYRMRRYKGRMGSAF